MKFGTLYSYWGTKWQCDYLKTLKRVSDIGFDIMDTMGAGDSYFATFLTYILRHKEPEFFKEESKDDGNVKELLKKAMQAGAEFASKICGVEGAFGYGTPIAGRIIDNRNN